jgi:hypothetical protein
VILTISLMLALGVAALVMLVTGKHEASFTFTIGGR